MIPIGLILLLIVIVFSIAVVVSNPTVFELSIFGAQIPVQAAGVYFTGAGAMLVLIVGLVLLRVGWRRSMARRKQVKSLKKAADGKAPAPSQPGATTDQAAVQPAAGPKPADAATPRSAGSTTVPGRDTGATATSAAGQQAGTTATSAAGQQAGTTAAEREALLAEVDEATRDDPKR